jgi:hypothetical protein
MHRDIPNYRRPVSFDSTEIDPAGELFLAVESPGWPQTIAVSTIFGGPCDPEAFRDSIIQAASSRPEFTAGLATVGRAPNQKLVWRHKPEPLSVELVDRSDEGVPGGDFHTWLPQIDIDREPFAPDVTIEHPARFRITTLSDDVHVLTSWLHHALGDGSTFLLFALEFLGRYHERVEGTVPEWMALASMHSVTATAPQIELTPWQQFVRQVIASEREFPRSEVAHITGTAGEPRPISVSLLLRDEDEINQMRDRARASGGSLTDIGVASAITSIARWNEERGVATPSQSHAVVVNLRGRVAHLDDTSPQNEIAMLDINSHPDQWSDPDRLLELVAATRTSKLEAGFDVQVSNTMRKVHRVLTRLTTRRRLAVINASWRPHTLNISNMGLVFPEVVDGKPTGGFGLPEIGGLSIHGGVIRSNTIPNSPNTLTMSRGPTGLGMVLSGNTATTSATELAELADRLLATMRAYG